MLTEFQKADVRRHLGFGPIGNLTDGQGNLSGGSFISYRFFVTHGQLEFRIDRLSRVEELILTGNINKLEPVNPNIPLPDGTFVDGYVPICNYLQSQIWTASDNLDTSKAGDWTARKDEVQARQGLYDRACVHMAEFLFVGIGYTKIRRGRLIS